MRRFDACALCLNRAREPLACSEGHLFCKECIYTDLRACVVPSVAYSFNSRPAVTQKKDIKRQKDRLEALKNEAEEDRTRARQAARERVLRDFERGQLGLGRGFIEKNGSEENGNRGEERKTLTMFPSYILSLDSPTVQPEERNEKLPLFPKTLILPCQRHHCPSLQKPFKNFPSKRKKLH